MLEFGCDLSFLKFILKFGPQNSSVEGWLKCVTVSRLLRRWIRYSRGWVSSHGSELSLSWDWISCCKGGCYKMRLPSCFVSCAHVQMPFSFHGLQLCWRMERACTPPGIRFPAKSWDPEALKVSCADMTNSHTSFVLWCQRGHCRRGLGAQCLLDAVRVTQYSAYLSYLFLKWRGPHTWQA